ncbi:unnamed protein product [Protopolystoma xenopodis]|uniref:Uncharacterized protein n=1 Tax=Protopolystoma xenopodis TaxID=117903 RepID=A0A3S5C5L1_9PLAT|nr:unnamed protein product [Protopolystoma xenopodis]
MRPVQARNSWKPNFLLHTTSPIRLFEPLLSVHHLFRLLRQNNTPNSIETSLISSSPSQASSQILSPTPTTNHRSSAYLPVPASLLCISSSQTLAASTPCPTVTGLPSFHPTLGGPDHLVPLPSELSLQHQPDHSRDSRLDQQEQHQQQQQQKHQQRHQPKDYEVGDLQQVLPQQHHLHEAGVYSNSAAYQQHLAHQHPDQLHHLHHLRPPASSTTAYPAVLTTGHLVGSSARRPPNLAQPQMLQSPQLIYPSSQQQIHNHHHHHQQQQQQQQQQHHQLSQQQQYHNRTTSMLQAAAVAAAAAAAAAAASDFTAFPDQSNCSGLLGLSGSTTASPTTTATTTVITTTTTTTTMTMTTATAATLALSPAGQKTNEAGRGETNVADYFDANTDAPSSGVASLFDTVSEMTGIRQFFPFFCMNHVL